MNNPVLRRLMSTVLAVLLFIYVGYQIYNSHYKKLQTETADYFTASDSVQADGVAVRDETVLSGKTGGVVDYVVENGGRIGKGGTVAQLYANEQQASAQRKLQETDGEIKQLESLGNPGDTFSVSPDAINRQIADKLTEFLGASASPGDSGYSLLREDFVYLLNEKQIVTGKSANFSSRIKALQEQKNTLAGEAGTASGSIVSPVSGYFINRTDGFEKVFVYGKVLGITPEQIKSALSLQPAAGNDSAGKVCKDFDWYFVFTVSPEYAGRFRQKSAGDGSVSVNFPFVSSETVPAEVVAVNQKDQDSEAAVILRCGSMNSELASIRKETAQVVVQNYTGIRVSQQAVHFETVTKKVKKDGKTTDVKREVKGVYIVHGNELEFCQIFPEYSTPGYVICDPRPSEDDLMTDSTVSLHDEVIVEGTDLYNGKVIQ